jgi:fermentation-respiration switch protein FrsA (DUF1100 family)
MANSDAGGARWRFRPLRLLTALIVVCVLGYAAAIVRLMTQEPRLVFRTDVARADAKPAFPFEQIDLPRADRARQFAWVMKRDASAGARDAKDVWVLFLHGNASTIASRWNVSHYRRLRDLGLNLIAPEYRGYNGLEGAPSESGVAADARAAYEYLRSQKGVPAERLVIYGWSLGAAIAVELASQVDTRAIILEGAPASLAAIGQERYPFFPIRLIMRNPFDAVLKVGRIRAPKLFLHSPEDIVVPFTQGRQLYDAALSPKTFVEVRGGHVEASEIDHEVFYGAIRHFLVDQDLLPPDTVTFRPGSAQ